MSSHLGVGKTLELLERLKSSVRDFNAREEKLNQEFRSRLNIERARRQEATDAIAQQFAADLAQANFNFQTAKANTSTLSRYRPCRWS